MWGWRIKSTTKHSIYLDTSSWSEPSTTIAFSGSAMALSYCITAVCGALKVVKRLEEKVTASLDPWLGDQAGQEPHVTATLTAE